MGKGLDTYIGNYDILFTGEFNSEFSESWLNDLGNIYNLKKFVKEATSC